MTCNWHQQRGSHDTCNATSSWTDSTCGFDTQIAIFWRFWIDLLLHPESWVTVIHPHHQHDLYLAPSSMEVRKASYLGSTQFKPPKYVTPNLSKDCMTPPYQYDQYILGTTLEGRQGGFTCWWTFNPGPYSTSHTKGLTKWTLCLLWRFPCWLQGVIYLKAWLVPRGPSSLRTAEFPSVCHPLGEDQGDLDYEVFGQG